MTTTLIENVTISLRAELGTVLRRNSAELLDVLDRTLAALPPAGRFAPGTTLSIEETRRVMAINELETLRQTMLSLGRIAPQVDRALAATLPEQVP